MKTRKTLTGENGNNKTGNKRSRGKAVKNWKMQRSRRRIVRATLRTQSKKVRRRGTVMKAEMGLTDTRVMSANRNGVIYGGLTVNQ